MLISRSHHTEAYSSYAELQLPSKTTASVTLKLVAMKLLVFMLWCIFVLKYCSSYISCSTVCISHCSETKTSPSFSSMIPIHTEVFLGVIYKNSNLPTFVYIMKQTVWSFFSAFKKGLCKFSYIYSIDVHLRKLQKTQTIKYRHRRCSEWIRNAGAVLWKLEVLTAY